MPSSMASMFRSDILDRCGVSPGGTTNSIISSRAPLPPAAAMLARMRSALLVGPVLQHDRDEVGIAAGRHRFEEVASHALDPVIDAVPG